MMTEDEEAIATVLQEVGFTTSQRDEGGIQARMHGEKVAIIRTLRELSVFLLGWFAGRKEVSS